MGVYRDIDLRLMLVRASCRIFAYAVRVDDGSGVGFIDFPAVPRAHDSHMTSTRCPSISMEAYCHFRHAEIEP